MAKFIAEIVKTNSKKLVSLDMSYEITLRTHDKQAYLEAVMLNEADKVIGVELTDGQQ
jgi:hypothetical protein